MMVCKSRYAVQLLALACCCAVQAQNFDPPYPRVVVGGQAVPYGEYSPGAKPQLWAKYDLITFDADIANGGPQFAALLRQLNPDAILLGATIQGVWPGSDPMDFHALHSYSTSCRRAVNGGDTEVVVESTAEFPAPRAYIFIGDEAFLYNVKTDSSFINTEGDQVVGDFPSGTKITTPVRFAGMGMIPNITDFAAMVDDTTAWQYLVDKRFVRADFSNFNGTAWDAFREFFYGEELEDADFNLNGVNDIEEHGLEWVNDQWGIGVTKMLTYERQKLEELHPGQPGLILANCGGGGGERVLFAVANGIEWEGFMRFAAGWEEAWGLFANMLAWLHNGVKPSVYYIKDYVKESFAEDGKDDFEYMRYGLTTTLLGDGYYSRTFGDWYYITYWYDEFDTELGYPTTDPYKLSNGSYVRFFDNGAVICNPTGTVVTTTDMDLSGVVGYEGPYYRFRGGQDPDFNNGELFNSVELYGETGDRPKRNRGDGILLFKVPAVGVSDIIIGNYNNNDTSPGSRPAQYQGGWVPKNSAWVSFEANNPYYTVWTASPSQTAEGYGYFVASPGSGEATATYTPTIGSAGYYEVFEWHGWHGDNQESYQEASNVPWELVIDGELEWAGVIDQTMNYGQWNKLGLFYFPEGNNGYVRITNNANGYVISDAFCFRYHGTEKGDNEPPSPPKGVHIKNNDQ